MKLKSNPTFLRHKQQIEGAIKQAPSIHAKNGQYLYEQMLQAAEDLDNSLAPDVRAGMDVSPQVLTIKRDEFQKRCRDLGEWLKDHAPDLELTWN
jgi:hypothetical protein